MPGRVFDLPNIKPLNKRRARFTDPETNETPIELLQAQLEDPSVDISALEGMQPIDADPIDELFKESDATGKFKEHLSHAPKREDFKNSLGRKVLTALTAGATGFATGDPIKAMGMSEHILDSPFEKAKSDFEDEGKRLSTLGSLEDKDKDNKRGAFMFRESARKNAENEDLKRLQQEGKVTKDENDRLQKELNSGNTERHQRALEEIARANSETMRMNAESAATAKSDKKIADLSKFKSNQYEKASKAYTQAKMTHDQIKQIPRDGNASDQLTMLYKFIQGLDNSTVREGEARLAQDAQSFGAKIGTYMSKFTDNPRLMDPKVVQDFFNSADNLFKGARNYHRDTQRQYKELASKQGLDYGLITNYDPDIEEDGPSAPQSSNVDKEIEEYFKGAK